MVDENGKAPEMFFNTVELKIISEFKDGKTIRKIADETEGYGRTKITNIINKYKNEFPEEAKEIEQKLKENKFHKKEGETVELLDITDEQIAQAYEDIQNNDITLTAVAKSLGRTKDYIRKKILEYINNPEEEKEFVDILKSNQHKQKKSDFLEMSEQEKKEFLFKKLNRRRSLNNRNEYENSFLEKKYERLRRYLLEIRNQNIPKEDRLSEDNFFKILYDTPTLLSSSLRQRIVPALENLDYHNDIGTKNATKIIRDDASILCSSMQRTNLQIRILTDNGYLENFLQKPRNFRTSPEMIYGLIEFHKSRKEKNDKDSNVFITKSKLEQKYGMTPELLVKRFDVKETYGDDEYFSK